MKFPGKKRENAFVYTFCIRTFFIFAFAHFLHDTIPDRFSLFQGYMVLILCPHTPGFNFSRIAILVLTVCMLLHHRPNYLTLLLSCLSTIAKILLTGKQIKLNKNDRNFTEDWSIQRTRYIKTRVRNLISLISFF